jgi:hypothetical protein
VDRTEWLVKFGRDWLESVSPQAADVPVPQLLPWQRELVREQLALRRRAAARFPDPTKWLWTARSLAQSSDWWCAKFKASCFPPMEPVVDGCCGVGVDLAALALRGATLGIDRDPELVALANANLKAHGLAASATVGDVPENVPHELTWLHLDPDRRSADGKDTRLHDAELFSPSLAKSLELAQRARGAMIKLAPGTKLDRGELPSGSSSGAVSKANARWWLGNLGECRQQILVTGELVEIAGHQGEGERAAVLCEPNSTKQIRGFASPIVSGRDKPLKYVYDCHAVLHAAQLQVCWAESVDALPLGTSQGYFTADNLIHSDWAQAFEVIDVLPWDQRRVKRWLRERRIGEVEVKKRLLQLDANEQQRLLRGKGDEKVTLMITRIGDRVRAIAARRLVVEG